MVKGCIAGNIFCSRIIDYLSFCFSSPWEKDYTYSLSSSGYEAKIWVYIVCLWLYLYQNLDSSRIIQVMQPYCYTGWGYTGYKVLIWFSALWILVFYYLYRYWYQIPLVIFSYLKCVPTHHKMSLHQIFWLETKGCELWSGQDSKVWFSQNAESRHIPTHSALLSCRFFSDLKQNLVNLLHSILLWQWLFKAEKIWMSP